MTEHEFMKQVITDGEDFLATFEAFMVDEAHELRKTTLMVMGIIKRFISTEKGKNHKIIVTSATLDTKLFEKYFSEMKYILIEAQTPTYDVEIFYTSFPDLETNIIENTASHLKVIFDHIKKTFKMNQKKPNILVFLPSIKEIKE